MADREIRDNHKVVREMGAFLRERKPLKGGGGRWAG